MTYVNIRWNPPTNYIDADFSGIVRSGRSRQFAQWWATLAIRGAVYKTNVQDALDKATLDSLRGVTVNVPITTYLTLDEQELAIVFGVKGKNLLSSGRVNGIKYAVYCMRGEAPAVRRQLFGVADEYDYLMRTWIGGVE